jgi:hypothetical protein
MHCGWCDGKADAEYIDNGVGMQQVAAGVCGDCGATQVGPYDDNSRLEAHERKRGWTWGVDTGDYLLYFPEENDWLTGRHWVQRMLRPWLLPLADVWRIGDRVIVPALDGPVHVCQVMFSKRAFEDYDKAFLADCGVSFEIAGAFPSDAPTCFACIIRQRS